MINIEEKENDEGSNSCFEKIKYEKRVLHGRYIASISISISVFLIITKAYSSSELVQQLSMASTVASIILSVIAIIMSITGEGKTDAIKNQMIETTQELKRMVKKVQKINTSVDESLQELKNGLTELQRKIDDVPDSTAKKIYSKEKKEIGLVETKVNNIGSNDEGWKRINDKREI